mgnify:CR=1 FL=1
MAISIVTNANSTAKRSSILPLSILEWRGLQQPSLMKLFRIYSNDRSNKVMDYSIIITAVR